MNTNNITGNKTGLFSYLGSKLALRLWGAMMLLVCFGVAILWVVQILLLEPNYIDATIANLENQVAPVAQDLAAMDATAAENAIHYLSKTTGGRIYLVEADGQKFGYNGGMEMSDTELRHATFLEQNYKWVIDGGKTSSVLNAGKSTMMVVLGVPVTYMGEPAAVFVYDSLSEIETLQELNRRQLVIISIVLAVAASAIAVILTRNFTKPILRIKNTVERMTEGDLTATPDVVRSDELGQLSHSVTVLGQALQRVDVLRKDVIANVSHELRAPLALITGYAEMVRDITWKDDAKRESDMNLIMREAGRMSQMVDDIMDYSQFQAGYIQLHKEEYNLHELIAAEVDVERQVAADFGIQIELNSFSKQIVLPLDVMKISQVLRNLLGNAVNHTANGMTIEVAITQNEDEIKVAISNPAEPIPEEELPTIWERYQRVQHQGGRKEGTGIGLSIVSTILDAHGMRYGVACKDGRNTFWFAAGLFIAEPD